MKRLTVLVLAALLGAGTLAAQSPAKRRVAVLDFDYATVHQYVYDLFGSDQDIGKGIADMLVTNLVRNGTYSVIERKQLDRVLQEQNFQQSGRADPSSAVQLARILGVDAIIIGSITQFGRDDKKLGVGRHRGAHRRHRARRVREEIRQGGGADRRAHREHDDGGDPRRVDRARRVEALQRLHGRRAGDRRHRGRRRARHGQLELRQHHHRRSDPLGGGQPDERSWSPRRAGSRRTWSQIQALVADVSGGEVTINVGTGAGVRWAANTT